MPYKHYINASEIGQANYCIYSVYLKKMGVKPNQKNRRLMEHGTKAHVKMATNNGVVNDGGCYIATHLYGQNHRITCELRRWRDQTLKKQWVGLLLIRLYYWLSPKLISQFGHSKRFNNSCKTLIKALYKWIVK